MSQLPRELVGEILCRLPTKSLARFRAVCKQWKAIWEDKSFFNNYLSRTHPQFMVRTPSQTCSIEINLDDESIFEHDITLDFPCETPTDVSYCDGFVLFGMDKKGFAIWNPWVKQFRFIENQEFSFGGIGYDNIRPETGYKIFGLKYFQDNSKLRYKFAIYECKSEAWKFIIDTREEPSKIWLESTVSINGNLYFIVSHSKTYKCFIQSFDFSKYIFKTICALPSIEGFSYTRALEVFRGDRLCLLMQSKLTKKVEIFVTKQKVDGNGEDIVWINFMTANLPSLQPQSLCPYPSYFVDDNKRLFVCTCDESEHPCIYVIKGHVFKKISIGSVLIDHSFPCLLYNSFTSYFPSFIPIHCV